MQYAICNMQYAIYNIQLVRYANESAELCYIGVFKYISRKFMRRKSSTGRYFISPAVALTYKSFTTMLIYCLISVMISST
jgi:hypothetical protein